MDAATLLGPCLLCGVVVRVRDASVAVRTPVEGNVLGLIIGYRHLQCHVHRSAVRRALDWIGRLARLHVVGLLVSLAGCGGAFVGADDLGVRDGGAEGDAQAAAAPDAGKSDVGADVGQEAAALGDASADAPTPNEAAAGDAGDAEASPPPDAGPCAVDPSSQACGQALGAACCTSDPYGGFCCVTSSSSGLSAYACGSGSAQCIATKHPPDQGTPCFYGALSDSDGGVSYQHEGSSYPCP